jgi:hypothetical protein
MFLSDNITDFQEWNDLVTRNFFFAVRRYFEPAADSVGNRVNGVDVVVLGFDDYRYVSSAKSITQANRSKKAAEFHFDDRQLLEPRVPADYNERLRNRAYKRAVIDYIINSLPGMLNLNGGRSLIIDYVDCPVRFFLNQDTGKLDKEYMQLPPMGENDVKFTRFCALYGDCVAHSVDGDYIPIALMEHERQLSLASDGVARVPSKIAIYRLEYNMETRVVSSKVSGNKRLSDGSVVGKKDAARKPRTWEFVDVTLLYNTLSKLMVGFSSKSFFGVPGGGVAPPVHHMKLLACLIGFTGTDFTRGLPRLTPGRIWDALGSKKMWAGFRDSFHGESTSLVVDHVCDCFVAQLYKEVFPKHTSGNNLSVVLRSLQSSKLSDK